VDRSRQGRSKHEPLRDKLTDLPTRAVLREHLALAVARAEVEDREVALLHVGVDSFNLVNDSLGRDGGDAALREIALRLRDLAGPTRIVARPGADQFCVMLADARGDADRLTEIVAGQIGAALHDPIEVDGVRFELTASTGASVFPHDARDATSLIRHAEAAMHDAKAIGEDGSLNRYVKRLEPRARPGGIPAWCVYRFRDGLVASIETYIDHDTAWGRAQAAS
jgi:diguanylate cyclase (GGDEF)-like protein